MYVRPDFMATRPSRPADECCWRLPQAFALEGVYAAGYAKVYGLISDSGWRMVREADEADEEEDLADTSDNQPQTCYAQGSGAAYKISRELRSAGAPMCPLQLHHVHQPA
eukprot:scaffold1017_cov374-Prasinococcus_capsulatus_cf.AAC.3